MPVILTVFFYLDGCFAFTSLNAADDSLFWSRCKVQIPTIMSVINRLMRETNLSSFFILCSIFFSLNLTTPKIP